MIREHQQPAQDGLFSVGVDGSEEQDCHPGIGTTSFILCQLCISQCAGTYIHDPSE